MSVSRVEADAAAVSRTEASLVAIAANDQSIKAFCDVNAMAARSAAAALDAVAESERGLLHGVPVAIKEVFDVAGCRCGWGTPIHAARVPTHDCPVVERLKSAGAVVIGTTASTEYAMARAAPTGNPYALERTPGASSSGSAAAVAARFVDLAIGSQTIGSGIRPAAYCGVLGLKPTHGVIPLSGAMPLSPPLDHAVVMARDVALVERALHVLSGQVCAWPGASADGEGLRIGLAPPWFSDPVDERVWRLVRTAADHLAGGGARVVTMPDSISADERECLETILAVDMWRNHGADALAAGHTMSPQLLSWLERGRMLGDAAYERELARRDDITRAMDAVFDEHDVVATLATTGIAPLRSEGTGSRAPQRVWSLVGYPTLAVPVGLIDGLPVAVQLIARPRHERSLLALARRITGHFTIQPPPLSPGAAKPDALATPQVHAIENEVMT